MERNCFMSEMSEDVRLTMALISLGNLSTLCQRIDCRCSSLRNICWRTMRPKSA